MEQRNYRQNIEDMKGDLLAQTLEIERLRKATNDNGVVSNVDRDIRQTKQDAAQKREEISGLKFASSSYINDLTMLTII